MMVFVYLLLLPCLAGLLLRSNTQKPVFLAGRIPPRLAWIEQGLSHQLVVLRSIGIHSVVRTYIQRYYGCKNHIFLFLFRKATGVLIWFIFLIPNQNHMEVGIRKVMESGQGSVFALIE